MSLSDPEVPVTPTEYVVLVVLLDADAVRSTEAVPPEVRVTLLELRETVGGCLADGVNDIESETEPLNPLTLDKEIVEFPVSPFARTMRFPGVVVPIVKVGVGAWVYVAPCIVSGTLTAVPFATITHEVELPTLDWVQPTWNEMGVDTVEVTLYTAVKSSPVTGELVINPEEPTIAR